jgi:hypothetical protein
VPVEPWISAEEEAAFSAALETMRGILDRLPDESKAANALLDGVVHLVNDQLPRTPAVRKSADL